jgi:hypothetical protein
MHMVDSGKRSGVQDARAPYGVGEVAPAEAATRYNRRNLA